MRTQTSLSTIMLQEATKNTIFYLMHCNFEHLSKVTSRLLCVTLSVGYLFRRKKCKSQIIILHCYILQPNEIKRVKKSSEIDILNHLSKNIFFYYLWKRKVEKKRLPMHRVFKFMDNIFFIWLPFFSTFDIFWLCRKKIFLSSPSQTTKLVACLWALILTGT